MHETCLVSKTNYVAQQRQQLLIYLSISSKFVKQADCWRSHVHQLLIENMHPECKYAIAPKIIASINVYTATRRTLHSVCCLILRLFLSLSIPLTLTMSIKCFSGHNHFNLVDPQDQQSLIVGAWTVSRACFRDLCSALDENMPDLVSQAEWDIQRLCLD